MDTSLSIRELGSGPGTDTRQWTSYGTVIPDAGSTRSVRFSDSSGAPLAHGVLVDVKLHPSGTVVPCRVASMCAGNGEGEFYPFVAGDEVLVAITEGDERAGCVILGRLNQSHDVFPQTVAGMDVTQNNFGFRRHVAPFVVEVGQGYVIRQAPTGAQLAFDQTGQVWLADADGSQLAMTPDVVSLMLVGETVGLQIDVSNQQVNLVAGGTNFQVSDGKVELQTGGTVSLASMGAVANLHMTHLEGVVCLLNGLLVGLAAVLAEAGATPLTGPTLALLLSPAPPIANPAIMTQGIPAAASAIITPYLEVIAAALAVPKEPPAGLLVIPGVGLPGFMVG